MIPNNGAVEVMFVFVSPTLSHPTLIPIGAGAFPDWMKVVVVLEAAAAVCFILYVIWDECRSK